MISIIGAISQNRVIGSENKIPWRLSHDLERFKTLTLGHPVIMGRKTFESLPVKLEGRSVIVLSKTMVSEDPDIKVARSIEEAIELAKRLEGGDEIFIAGGAEVYRIALELADKIYLTELSIQIDGDTYFPELDKDQWIEVSKKRYFVNIPGVEMSYSFKELERIK